MKHNVIKIELSQTVSYWSTKKRNDIYEGIDYYLPDSNTPVKVRVDLNTMQHNIDTSQYEIARYLERHS